MPWNDLASNQMVSFTDAQTSGFTLKSGQSHVTSNQCMTRLDIVTKYNVSISGYADNQLVPKSALDGTPVNCVVSDWSDWSECVEGSQTRTRTVITPASNGGTACPVLTESRSCTQTVRLSYAVNLSGGISMGGFSINANGVNVFSTNSTDSGYVDVPINSEISVVINAPVGGAEPTFNSQVFAYDSSGNIASDSGPYASATITFIATEDVSIEAAASVSSNGENVKQ
jgi:hypothetical protein